VPSHQSEEPKRNRDQKKQLAKDQEVTAYVASFHPVDSLPRHQQNPAHTKKIGNRHKDAAELVPFLHPANPIATIFPVLSTLPLSFFIR